MKARRVGGIVDKSLSDDAAVRASIERGDFEITTDESSSQRWFWFRCPGRCGQVSAIALRPVKHPRPGQHSWEWDGNQDAPTLKPSINHVGCWHGFLTRGEFTSC